MTQLRPLLAASLLLVPGLGACESDPEPGCSDAPGVACVFAGTGKPGFNGDGLVAGKTMLYSPIDLEVAPDGTLWVLDWNNHRIRHVHADGRFETVIGADLPGDGPPEQNDYTAPGVPGLSVGLNHPTDIQFGPDGQLVFAAWHNHKLRVSDPETGLTWVMSGRGAGLKGDGSEVSGALFNQPKALQFAPDGSLYVLDQRNERVRKVGPNGGTVETVVGTGEQGYGGDGGAPLDALLAFEKGGNPEPSGALALDAAGRLYIADSLNHRVRRVDFAANTIETIAGTGTPGFSGDGGAATAAQLNNPRDLEIGPDGRLYVADSENHAVRVVDLASGVIQTIVGTGVSGDAGVGGPATEAQLSRPWGVALTPDGDLYVSDTFNHRILRVRGAAEVK